MTSALSRYRWERHHPWSNGKVSQLPLPKDFLIVLVMRKEEKIVPNGDTVILPGDLLVIAARAFEDRENLTLREITVDKTTAAKARRWNRWRFRREC